MQIREQGRKLQCIRSVYDPAPVKRSHQKVVATFPRYITSMPTEGLDELTVQERKELDDWLTTRRNKQQSEHRSFVARSAEKWLGELSAAVTSNEPAMTPERAAAIWKGISDVAKALRKAGHPKPKAARKTTVTPVEARAPVKKLPKAKGQGDGQAHAAQTAKPVKRVRTPKEGPNNQNKA